MFQLLINPQRISEFVSIHAILPAQTAPQIQGPPDTWGPRLARAAARHRLPAAAGGPGGSSRCKDLGRREHRRVFILNIEMLRCWQAAVKYVLTTVWGKIQ